MAKCSKCRDKVVIGKTRFDQIGWLVPKSLSDAPYKVWVIGHAQMTRCKKCGHVDKPQRIIVHAKSESEWFEIGHTLKSFKSSALAVQKRRRDEARNKARTEWRTFRPFEIA